MSRPRDPRRTQGSGSRSRRAGTRTGDRRWAAYGLVRGRPAPVGLQLRDEGTDKPSVRRARRNVGRSAVPTGRRVAGRPPGAGSGGGLFTARTGRASRRPGPVRSSAPRADSAVDGELGGRRGPAADPSGHFPPLDRPKPREGGHAAITDESRDAPPRAPPPAKVRASASRSIFGHAGPLRPRRPPSRRVRHAPAGRARVGARHPGGTGDRRTDHPGVVGVERRGPGKPLRSSPARPTGTLRDPVRRGSGASDRGNGKRIEDRDLRPAPAGSRMINIYI